MGKKITQYTAVTSTNPDNGSLLDVSEKSGSAYATKKWSLLQVKTWLATYLQLPFSSITSTPTTISGYGITDAVDTTGGTTNYISKFVDANTIEESQIQDDGTKIGINTIPITGSKIHIVSDQTAGIKLISNISNINTGIGISTTLQGTNNDANIGITSNAYNGNFQTIGVQGLASSSSGINNGIEGISSGTSTNIGLRGYAVGGSSNYGAQLQDGTQAIGKILKSATADGKANWAYFPCEVQLAVSDETTALTTGAGKITFRMPYAMVLQEVRASLVVAGTTSGITTIDINESGATILSTKLTIDLTEKTSTTASTPAVISDTALADDAEITIDIDAISGGATEKGLKVLLKGYRLL